MFKITMHESRGSSVAWRRSSDVGMIERCEQLGLTLEASDALRVARKHLGSIFTAQLRPGVVSSD